MKILWFSTLEEFHADSVCSQSDDFRFGGGGSDGVILIDNLEKGKTGQYYVSEYGQPKEGIKSKRGGKMRACVLLLQDNAPDHTVHVAVTEADNFGFELLPDPLNSSDLVPSYFFLFPKFKCGIILETIMRHHFEDNSEIICAVGEFLEDRGTFFCDGIAMLKPSLDQVH